MASDKIIAVLQAALDAFNRNDLEALKNYVDKNITYIIRGRGKVSGTYRGQEAVARALKKVKELTGGTMFALPEVVLMGEDAVMAYMRVSGTRPDGRTYDQYQAYLYRFDQGKLVEGQTIPVDQMAFEQFFND